MVRIIKPTVFVDESGTLPDPEGEVVVVAAVGVGSPQKVERIIKTVRKKGSFRKGVGEIKFYTAGDKSKTLFFQELVEAGFDLFVLTVDKMGRKIPDSPRHFALLCWLLLTEVLNFYPGIREVIFDRHFHREKDIEEFNQVLGELLGSNMPTVKHVDSSENRKVNVADMVAGAVLAKETGREDRFYNVIKGRIICEARINWPEAKRKLLSK